MTYRKIFGNLLFLIFIFGIWYTAIELNSDYWNYVNNIWQDVRFDPFKVLKRYWFIFIALVGCLLSVVSFVFVSLMTWFTLREIRKGFITWRQLELF